MPMMANKAHGIDNKWLVCSGDSVWGLTHDSTRALPWLGCRTWGSDAGECARPT